MFVPQAGQMSGLPARSIRSESFDPHCGQANLTSDFPFQFLMI